MAWGRTDQEEIDWRKTVAAMDAEREGQRKHSPDDGFGGVVAGGIVFLAVIFSIIQWLGNILPLWVLIQLAVAMGVGCGWAGGTYAKRRLGASVSVVRYVQVSFAIMFSILLFALFYDFEGWGYKTFLFFNAPLTAIFLVLLWTQTWVHLLYKILLTGASCFVCLISYAVLVSMPPNPSADPSGGDVALREKLETVLKQGQQFTGTFTDSAGHDHAINAQIVYDPKTRRLTGTIDYPDLKNKATFLGNLAWYHPNPDLSAQKPGLVLREESMSQEPGASLTLPLREYHCAFINSDTAPHLESQAGQDPATGKPQPKITLSPVPQ